MPNSFDAATATFGVELECYLPEGSTAHAAAAAVSQRLGLSGVCISESYNHYTRPHWKVVTDGSLGDVSRGVEFVSPVLRGEEGLAQVIKVCEALTDFGCTVSRRCGLHVHVGVGRPDISFFKNIVKLYSVFEPIIDSMLPPSRRASNNGFCRSMTAARPANIDRAQNLEALISAVLGPAGGSNERRYYKLNLASYGRHQTVEFRQHSGTLDGDKAIKWTRLCIQMVAAAMRSDLNLGTTSTGSVANRARPGSKAYQIGQMFLRPEGVTGREVCTAMNWPSVSMPQQAKICGLEFTTQRTGREVRYFARTTAVEIAPTVTVSVEGFAQLIGASHDERQYMERRVSDLSGAVAWAA